MRWGTELEDCFDLIVFLYVPTEIRIERLRKRELEELGQLDEDFLQWASEYDDGPASGRSLARSRAWLRERNCPVLCIEGEHSVEERCDIVLAQIGTDQSDGGGPTLPFSS